MKREDIIKIIDGEVYYHYDYTDYLYNIINKAIEYIENNMTTINKEQAKGTRLQIGTFMWNIDKLLDILKGSDKE